MLALIAAAAVAASQPAAQPPPAPATLKREEVEAWTRRYVHGRWTLIGYDYEGVKLVAPGAIRSTPEGFAEADVRTELFHPIALKAGVTARSGVGHWNVDCEGGKLAVLTMTVYAGNNLDRELARMDTHGPEWQEPVGSEAQAMKQVCQAIGRKAKLGPVV
jgi:hypothetical protein